MAKETKEIKEEEKEEVKTPAEAAEEKTEKEHKKMPKWLKWVLGILGLAGAGVVTAAVTNKRGYARGVSDTTEYYKANPVEKTVYVPCLAAESDGIAETETTELANTDEF